MTATSLERKSFKKITVQNTDQYKRFKLSRFVDRNHHRIHRIIMRNFRIKLGYLKDCNAAAHSVDSDIFYVVINLFVRSESYIITFIS